MHSHKNLHRRTVLRAAGVSLGLPFLDAMLPKAVGSPSRFRPWSKSEIVQPRLLCCYVPNGVNIEDWVPEDSGPSYTLSPTLQELKDFRADFTVLSGLGHPASEGGHSGADTWLTGADLKSRPGTDYANSLSMDQHVAQKHGVETRFPSLQLGDQSGTGSAGHSHTLSFDLNGTPLPAENSPRRLFERLFVPETAADRRAAHQRYAERRSILDQVMREARQLSLHLGTADRQKLDEYLSSVRQTEQQVERLQAWLDRPKPEVSGQDLQLSQQPGNAHDRPMWLDVMLELTYLAFITDATRVITFEWSREAGGYGGGGENHHELSHHGGDPQMLQKLAVIDRFHLSRLAHLLSLLKATPESDSTMLDRTLILYGSGMNSGQGGEHSPKNLPTLVAGGGRLGLKHGQHLAFDPENHPPLANVLLTLIQCMGIETSKFADATGTLSGLT